MAKIGVLDWAYLTYHVWQSLPTRKIPWTRPTEAEEGIHRICEWVYALYLEHGWDRLIIAKDSPGYWRHEALSDWHRKIPRYVDADGKYYVLYNGALLTVTKETDADGDFGSTLGKMDAKTEKALLPKLTLLEVWPDEMPEPKWPKYKGNRHKDDSWACETTLEQYYTIRDRLADRIGRLCNGKPVGYKGAEADDISAVISAGKHDVLLMSGDGDWRQNLLRGTHVRFHNLYNDAKVEFHVGVAEEIKRDLLIKIIGGDSGDNVRGCPRLDRRGRSCLAKDGAKKLLLTTPLQDIKPLLDPLYVQKNIMMMHLSRSAIPPHIWTGITEALRAPEKEYSTKAWTWDELGLTATERERMEVAGGAARVFTQWKSDPAKVAEALA